MNEYLVIGAGIAGLTAALCLQKEGASPLVLEAAPRIGGRVRSALDARTGIELGDLGPTWVWPRWQPDVARWMARLGLRAVPQYEQGDGVLDGYGPVPTRHPIPAQDGISRLDGGPYEIVRALTRRLAPGTVQTESKVTAITRMGSGVRVFLADGRALDAAKVIVAAPARIVAEHIRIDGLASDALSALVGTPTWMASQAKVVAVYDRPFWRDAKLSGHVASRSGPLAEIHDHSPDDAAFGALFGFVSWSPSARAADPVGLRAAIRRQFSRCLGPEAGQPRQLFIQDWAQEPTICSAADLAVAPRHPDVGPDPLRAGHLDDRLWFAVSETSTVSPGLIEGALTAGEEAARRCLSGSRPAGVRTSNLGIRWTGHSPRPA